MSNLKSAFVLFSLTFVLLGATATFAQESLFDTMYDDGARALLERRYSEAEKKLKAALREAEQFSASDARLQKSLKTLAELYDEEKKFDQSEPLYRRILANDEKSGSATPRMLAGDYTKLGSNLQDQNKYEDAITSYLKANELFGKAETEKGSAEYIMWPDENRVVALIKLASVYSDIGKTTDAEKYLREALSAAETMKDSLATGRALDALGRHYTTAGRYDEAESVLNRAITTKKELNDVGVRRLETSNTLMLFARLFHAQEKIKDALQMIETSYKMREKVLEDKDPRVYEPLLERATIYRDLGCYKDAIAELEKGKELVEKSLGDTSPRYAAFLRDLAGDYVSCSQYAKADPLLRKALSIDEAAFGKESNEVCLDLNALGMYYVYQGKYEDAEPIYKRALAIAEKKFGPNHVDVAAALNNLAWLYENQRKFAEARPLVVRGLAIREKALGDSHPIVARNIHNLAEIAIDERNYDEAKTLLERALKIQKDVLGPTHQDTVETMRDLSALLNSSKKFSDAEELYRAILNFDEKSNSGNPSIIAADMDNLARSLIDQSRGDEAKPFIEKSKEIKTKLPGFNEGSEGHAITIGGVKPGAAPLKPVADKWALVVGISNFKDPSINLQFAAKDAMDFRNYLIFEANFKPDHVKLLTDQNASRDNIVAHLGDKWLRKVAKNDDLVVIYLSTHGTSARKEVGDANFIVAYETNLSNAVLSGIPMQFFTTGIKDMVNCQRVVIIMDVCHGGALREKSLATAIHDTEKGAQKGSKALMRQPNMGFTAGGGSGGAGASANGAAHSGTANAAGSGGVSVGSGQIVVASSEADQVSWESKNYPNGVFTRQLIESLREHGAHTSVQQAYKTMRARVEQEVLRSRAEIQTPIMASNNWHGGDAFLSVKPAAPRAVVVPTAPRAVAPTAPRAVTPTAPRAVTPTASAKH